MREQLAKVIEKAIGIKSAEVMIPDRENFGHYSTNVAMKLAKTEKKLPVILAEEIKEKVIKVAPRNMFEKVEIAPPGFINFWFSKEFLAKEFERILKVKDFGSNKLGKGKRVIFEYSDPNIAKRMHVGHLRATIIGDALANIYEFSGYKVIRWNYIGDWGTQFGKMIAAYKLWGDKKTIQANPIEELQKLYVKFHDEEEKNPDLEKQGQAEFKKLEEGNPENKKLWEWFKKESLKEFSQIYKFLGVDFDVTIGEAFYEKDLKKLVMDLKKKKLAKESRGSLIFDLEKFGLPPALIQKSDGASLYMTRDIANMAYRLKKYKPAKIFYVVGNEQSLHFEQLFKVAEILGLTPTTTTKEGKNQIAKSSFGVGAGKAELKHLKFGLVLDEQGRKFTTRRGRVILLDELLSKVVKLARETVEEKSRRSNAKSEVRDSERRDFGASENSGLSTKEKEKIAETVGVGALKYNDLKENRHSDIVFNWTQMLSLSGNSGPYLQYTYARLSAILRKSKAQSAKSKSLRVDLRLLEKKEELDLMRKVLEFPDAVREAHDSLVTSNFSNYLYELANLANRFYETTQILSDTDLARKAARLALVVQVNVVLEKGLGLLGVKVLKSI